MTLKWVVKAFLYVCKHLSLQACFEECVFTGASSLTVFGISAVRGSWTCVCWTVWDVQSSDSISEIEPWEKAPEIGFASLGHSEHSWCHLLSSDSERCKHHIFYFKHIMMSLSNTSSDTFRVLDCFSFSRMSSLRTLCWSESSASALWDLLKNTRGNQAKRNSSSWWKHSVLYWNWWRSVIVSLSRQQRQSFCPGTSQTAHAKSLYLLKPVPTYPLLPIQFLFNFQRFSDPFQFIWHKKVEKTLIW